MQGKRGIMPQEALIVALSAIGPVLGSGIGVLKRPTTASLHNLLYFAAGIMLAISFLNLIPESIQLGGSITCVAGYMAARFLFIQISPQIMSLLVAATAGLMIYIAADELMPAARNNSGGKTIFFFIAGIIAIMLLELVA